MEKNLKSILIKYGFTFKKAYGQNFLTDGTLLDDIAELSGIDENTTVLEIGCGAGALTTVLCKRAKKVVGYEIDGRLKPVLSEVLDEFNNVEIVYKDVLKEDLNVLESKLGEGYIMVANLPYYITTPIIMEFIEKAKGIKSLVIMVQEEVAERLSAKAGQSEYGAITVAVNFFGSSKIIKRVEREKFTPVPNVDSAVVKIDVDREKYSGIDFSSVREAVRCGFQSRRKMLVNNIMNGYKIDRAKAESVLTEAEIPLTERGEKLDVNQYIRLAEELKRIKQ